MSKAYKRENMAEESRAARKKDDSLNETNFRDYAQKMIAKYNEKGMFVDAMLWASVIGHYERALTREG